MGKIAAMDVQTSSFTYLVWVTRANNAPSLASQRSSPSPAILFVWFFGNFREASHGSRRDRQAEYYAHEDADNAGHNGQSTEKKGSSGIRGKRSVERPTKADQRLTGRVLGS